MTFLDVVIAMLVLDAIVLWSLEYLLPTDTDAECARARRIKAGISRTFTFFFVGAVAGALLDTIFVQSLSILRPEALWVITGSGMITIGAIIVRSLLGLLPPERKRSRTIFRALGFFAFFAACTVLLLGSPTLLHSFDTGLPMYAALGLSLLAAGHLLLNERRGGASSD